MRAHAPPSGARAFGLGIALALLAAPAHGALPAGSLDPGFAGGAVRLLPATSLSAGRIQRATTDGSGDVLAAGTAPRRRRARAVGRAPRHRGRTGEADPAIASSWQRIQVEFLANQRAIIDTLAARGALRPGLGADEAADLL